MTNEIEVTKREMYASLECVKRTVINGFIPTICTFESALETHLEQLRQANEQLNIVARKRFEDIQDLEMRNTDLTNMNSILTDAYQQQKDVNRTAFAENRDLNDELVGIQGQLARMTEERDALRNRVQVLEYANQAAGAQLRTRSRLSMDEIRRAMDAGEVMIGCMHSFHLSSAAGEMCTFCGVAK